MRHGMFDLIKPVTNRRLRPLRRQHKVYANRTTLLGKSHNVRLDLLAGGHHQIGKLIDDHHDVGQFLWNPRFLFG